MEATKTVTLTNDLLVKLQHDKKAAWLKQRAIDDIDSSEYTEAALEVVKINAAIKSEIANLQKSANDAKIAEARNAEVSKLDAYDAAHLAAHAKGATDEQKSTFANLREEHINKLLIKFSPSVTKTAGNAKTSGTGTKYQGIIDGMNAGLNYDQLIANGFGDGTIRTVQSKEGYRKNADGTYTKK